MLKNMLKMKKLNIILFLLSFYLSIGIVSATTLDQYWICRDFEPTSAENFSQPINCIEETKIFLNTDSKMVIIVKLSDLIEGDEIRFEIKGPSNYNVTEETITVPENKIVLYDYEIVTIEGQERPLGKYSVKMFIKGGEALSDEFEIREETVTVPTCTDQGFYCCPEGKICISPEGGECETGTCCTSETQCQTISPATLSKTLITNCEEIGLNACGRVIKLYDYSIHGKLTPEQTIVMDFRPMDIDCYKKDDIAIAYYDEINKVWVERSTFIEKVSEDIYNAKAQINYLGYIALIRTKNCVPMLCAYGGYRTDPVGGYINSGEPITFNLCGMVSGCTAIKDGVCNKNCPAMVDPDCENCTSEAGDCCLISKDNKCDKDCAPYVDPDCCRKSDNLCCGEGSSNSDSEECDTSCNTGSTLCTGCTPAGGDCCNAAADSICDPDCPKLSNGVGYLDIDCCAAKGVSVTTNKGDCCNTATDGACDCDCIPGLDADCVLLKDCCGNNVCASGENANNCPSDCR